MGGLLSCVSSESDSGGRNLFFDVRQELLYTAPSADGVPPPAPRVVAEMFCRMVFLKAGELSQPPENVKQQIDARRTPLEDAPVQQQPQQTPWLDADLWTPLPSVKEYGKGYDKALTESISDTSSSADHSESSGAYQGDTDEAVRHGKVSARAIKGQRSPSPGSPESPNAVWDLPQASPAGGSIWDYLDAERVC